MEEAKDTLDLIGLYRKVMTRKSLILKVGILTFILSSIWILPQPRAYQSTTVVVPEVTKSGSSSGLAAAARSFGINIGNSNSSSDAFIPDLYPDVVSTNEFIFNLLGTKVTGSGTQGGAPLEMTYLEHLTRYLKRNPLTAPLRWAGEAIGRLISGEEAAGDVPVLTDPFHLSKRGEKLFDTVKENISCSVDKKTSVITIHVWDQDAQIAADIADTVRTRLQLFITEYRTHKTRIDLEYYTRLKEDAQKAYDLAADSFAIYSQSHQKNELASVQQELTALQDKLSLKRELLSSVSAQYEEARGRLQEETPAFTVLSRPSVSPKPSKPKRAYFVLVMLFLATAVTIGWILRDELKEQALSLIRSE